VPEALGAVPHGAAGAAEGDPAPLPYLADAADQAAGALDIVLEVSLLTPASGKKRLAPHQLSASNARHL